MSGLGFNDNSRLGMSKSISTLDFDKISQYMAELLPLPVCEKSPPSYWNSTSGFDFYLFIVIVIPKFVQTV